MSSEKKKVKFKKVKKFFDNFDGQCSDAWLTDIINGEIDIEKLKELINNDKKYPSSFEGLYYREEINEQREAITINYNHQFSCWTMAAMER